MRVKDVLKVRWKSPKGEEHSCVLRGESCWDLAEAVKMAFKQSGYKYVILWKHGNWFERLFWSKLYTIEDLEDAYEYSNSKES